MGRYKTGVRTYGRDQNVVIHGSFVPNRPDKRARERDEEEGFEFTKEAADICLTCDREQCRPANCRRYDRMKADAFKQYQKRRKNENG